MSVVRLTTRLWREYLHQNRVKASRQAAENRLRSKRQALIVEHMPHAADIAKQVWRRFTRCGQGGYGSKIELEDMVSCAYIGLTEAAGRWRPEKGDFKKYCFFRVRGAVIDAHRRQQYLETQHQSIDEWLEGTGNTEGHVDDAKQEPRLIARYLSDTSPLADELADRVLVRRRVAAAIDRLLPDEEQIVIRQALAGSSVASIAQELGHTPAWARSKLTAARDTVAAAVMGRAA